MNYDVKVITRSAKNEVTQEGNQLKVKLKSPPIKGRANRQLIKVLAQHFQVSPSQVTIKKGLTSKKKLVKIL